MCNIARFFKKSVAVFLTIMTLIPLNRVDTEVPTNVTNNGYFCQRGKNVTIKYLLNRYIVHV